MLRIFIQIEEETTSRDLSGFFCWIDPFWTVLDRISWLSLTL